MSVDVNIDAVTDLLGKVVTDLQENVAINNNAFTGTLKYVDDYTGFSSKPEEQSGNYLVLHAAANVEDAVISVKITNPVMLDADGIFVGRIADKDSQTITVVASADGYDSVTKTFSLTGLTCESA